MKCCCQQVCNRRLFVFSSYRVYCVDESINCVWCVCIDWAAMLEVADRINRDVDSGKNTLKAIKKRLGNSHDKTVSLTLTLLETCVKNTNKRFHLRVSDPAFLDVVVGLFFLLLTRSFAHTSFPPSFHPSDLCTSGLTFTHSLSRSLSTCALTSLSHHHERHKYLLIDWSHTR